MWCASTTKRMAISTPKYEDYRVKKMMRQRHTFLLNN